MKLTGYYDFEVATKRESTRYDQAISNVGFDSSMRNRAKISLITENKTDNNYLYGAHVQLKPILIDDSQYDNNIHKTFIYTETPYGRLEFGSNRSAASNMRIDMGKLSPATGGIIGDSYNFVNLNMNANNGSFSSPTNYKEFFIIGTEPLLDYIADTSFNDSEYQRKITYYSPEIHGFQMGISYIPDSTSSVDYKNYDSSSRNGSTSNEFLIYRKFRNAFSTAVTYANHINHNISYKFSYTSEYARSFVDTAFSDNRALGRNHGLQTNAFGGMITWQEFSLVGSYAIWDNKMMKKDSVAYSPSIKNAYVSTFGLLYNQGPVETSVGFMRSNYRRNILQTFSMASSYAIADGIIPYAEFDWMEMHSNQRYIQGKPRNHANLFIGGMRVKF